MKPPENRKLLSLVPFTMVSCWVSIFGPLPGAWSLCRRHALCVLRPGLGLSAYRLPTGPWGGSLRARSRCKGHERADDSTLPGDGAAAHQPYDSTSGRQLLPYSWREASGLPQDPSVWPGQVLGFLLLGRQPRALRVPRTAAIGRENLLFVEPALQESVQNQPLCRWQPSSGVEHHISQRWWQLQCFLSVSQSEEPDF